MKLSRIIENGDNLVSQFEESRLRVIGQDVIRGFEEDVESRRDWEEKHADALKLALQYFEKKTIPWPGAANVKYPLVLIACMQFNARAYPALVPGDRVVGTKVKPGSPPQLTELSQQIADILNWELLTSEWEEGHDTLLMMLPLIGTVFKKTYYDPEKGRNVSFPIHPSNFVVDYWAKSLEEAERKTYVNWGMTRNQIEEKIRLGEWADIDVSQVTQDQENIKEAGDEAKGFSLPYTGAAYCILEQCCWIDLDDDGYKEPYVVTVDRGSGNVLRITDNFDTITLVNKGSRFSLTPAQYLDSHDQFTIGKITEKQYYTKYGFVPSPDGGFYCVGLGTFLSPINRSANAVLNQLLDAGTLSNTSGGLLSRNIRLRSGKLGMIPGRWFRTDASSDELQKGVFPWPIKEPSNVLFLLLQLLLDAGQKIGSVSDTMMGKNPGQNQAATTTMTVLEQGLQVFSAIYKRVYRAMTHEFHLWYDLNVVYSETPELYQMDKNVIRPTADPSAVAQAQRMLKAEALVGRTQQMPHLYGMEGTVKAETMYLESLGIPNVDDWLKDAQEPSNPEAEMEQAELQMKQQDMQFNQQLAMMKEEREQERTKSTVMGQMATVKTKIEKSQLDVEKQAHQETLDYLELELKKLAEQREWRELRYEQERLKKEETTSGEGV